MADANHVGLGRITSIQDYYSPWPVYTPSAAGRAKFDMGVAEIAAPTIEPGSTEVKINVAVTYELE
jgi:uncharacterized protein YggE